jgi:hypothetical protein
MNRFRFSMGSFLVVVSALGLGLGAIVSQSEAATALAFTAFMSLLGLAAAIALSPRGERRAFCTGFAIFGLIYWLVEFQAPDGAPVVTTITSGWVSWQDSRSGSPKGPTLATRNLLNLIERSLTPNYRVGSRVRAAWNNNGRYYPATIVQEGQGIYQIQWVDGGTLQWTPANLIAPDIPTPLVASHAVMGGLFALMGGVLTLLLREKGEGGA